MVCFKLKMICCCLLWLSSYLFLHLLCVCVRSVILLTLATRFFCCLVTEIFHGCKSTNRGGDFYACFHTFQLIVWGGIFFTVSFLLSEQICAIACKCCSDCHFKHFIGFRNSDCMQLFFVCTLVVLSISITGGKLECVQNFNLINSLG